MQQEKAMTQTNPLATEPVGTLIRRYSVPAIISGVVSAIYNMVDQIFIGHGIGELGMAATNVAFPFTTICMALALLIGVGGASNASLMLGRGDREGASKIVGNAISMMVLAGVVLMAASLIFLMPLLRLFGATDPVMPYAQPYTFITALGIPFLIFSTAGSHIIRADGNPTYAMISVTAGAVFNLIFDPVFMFVFGWGIEGIAWATTLGQVLSTLIVVYYFIRPMRSVTLKKSSFKIKPRFIGRISALGIAASVNQVALAIVQIVLNNVLIHYGALSNYGSEIPLAVVGAVMKVNMLFFVGIIGISQGCQPIIGFNYGARNYARVKQTYKIGVIAASAIAVASFICYQLFPDKIMMIFGTGSDTYIEFATRYMRTYMAAVFLMGIQPFTSNFFTAIGKSIMGLIMSLTRQILFLVPLILILPMFFGIDGVLYAGPIGDTAASILAIVLIVREWKILTRQERELVREPRIMPDPVAE